VVFFSLGSFLFAVMILPALDCLAHDSQGTVGVVAAVISFSDFVYPWTRLLHLGFMITKRAPGTGFGVVLDPVACFGHRFG